MTWIMDNLASIVVVAVIVLLLVLDVRKLVRDRKSGKRSCGGNCAGCSGCGGHCDH